MKTKMLFTVALSALLFSFTGCSEDSSTSSNNSTSNVTISGDWIGVDASEDPQLFIALSIDGNKFVFEETEDLFSDEVDSYEGTWSSNGNTVTLDFNDTEIDDEKFTYSKDSEGEALVSADGLVALAKVEAE